MRKVGAVEAKSKFGQLLDWVEAGETVAITRRGKVVAHLAPPGAAFNIEAAEAAVERIRARRRGVTLGGAKIADLIAEGLTRSLARRASQSPSSRGAKRRGDPGDRG
jgi:prevent-host-death family protein